MKLNWKGNQRYTEDISKATIFRVEKPYEISIHKINGCGENLYLSCRILNISDMNLQTSDFTVAESKAIDILHNKAKKIYEATLSLLDTINNSLEGTNE